MEIYFNKNKRTMKKIIIFNMLIFFNFCFTQNKIETVEWLNSHLIIYTEKYPMGQYSIKIVDDKDWGEMIVITKITNVFGETYWYYSFLPETISNVILSPKTNDEFNVKIISKGESIYNVESKELEKELLIFCNGPNEEITRIRKGLLHLLELMGNKIKEKDYFKEK